MQRLRLVLLPGRARQCFCVLMNLTVVANSENNADGFDTKVEGNTTLRLSLPRVRLPLTASLAVAPLKTVWLGWLFSALASPFSPLLVNPETAVTQYAVGFQFCSNHSPLIILSLRLLHVRFQFHRLFNSSRNTG